MRQWCNFMKKEKYACHVDIDVIGGNLFMECYIDHPESPWCSIAEFYKRKEDCPHWQKIERKGK
jgi:hypothetical protein